MSENFKFANLFNDQKSKRATEMFKSTEATNRMKLSRAIRIDTQISLIKLTEFKQFKKEILFQIFFKIQLT